MNEAATLPLSPLDPVVARRRGAWVTVLAVTAAVGVVVLEETWLPRARVRLDLGEPLGMSLGGALDFPSAVVAAVVLFSLVEILSAAVSLARAAGAEGLRALPPAGLIPRLLILVAASAALASAPGLEARVVAAAVGLSTALWLRALTVGPGVLLLCSPSTAPATSLVGPLHVALLAVLLVGGIALSLRACARRFPLAACGAGVLLIVGVLVRTARSRLTAADWNRAEEGYAALVAIAFVGLVYGVRAWRRRSRR